MEIRFPRDDRNEPVRELAERRFARETATFQHFRNLPRHRQRDKVDATMRCNSPS